MHKNVQQLKENENAELLIGGDFNCAFSLKNDRGCQDKKSCETKSRLRKDRDCKCDDLLIQCAILAPNTSSVN